MSREMYLHSGTFISDTEGAPEISDIAVHLCREARFTGGTKELWTVGLHTMVVADLCECEMQHHGMLHDSAEVIIGDIPKGFKTPDMRAQEGEWLERIYKRFDLRLPTPVERAKVKECDTRALHAEAYLIGPPGVSAHYPKDHGAEAVMRRYMGMPYGDFLDDDGALVERFTIRLHATILRAGGTP